jgi:hypothetical protein
LDKKQFDFRRAKKSTMHFKVAVTLAVLAFGPIVLSQDDLPTFTKDAAGAFVWGDDNGSGAVSSIIRDPVTGNVIHKMSHGGIEVSSRAGFENIGSGAAGELLNFTTTIVNNTESELSVHHGGVRVDGHAALPLAVVPTKKGLKKRDRNQVWELRKMSCFSSGFLAADNFFSPVASSKVFRVAPKTALTVSLVTQDPRNYPFRCSMEGCYPTGTMRFHVTVNSTDYVFVWPGRSSVNCGK